MPPKIGFIGSIANNMYIMASCFRAMGRDAYYYHIPSNFMFSQPWWEDGDYYVPYGSLNDPRAVSQLRKDWQKPSWVVEINEPRWRLKLAQLAGARRYLSLTDWFQPNLVRELASEIYPFFDEDLRSCDWLVTTGSAGVIACHRSGRPFLFLPHGQELRDASGQPELVHFNGTRQVLAKAIQSATLCGSHGSDMKRLLKTLCGPERVLTLPFVVNPEIYGSQVPPPAFPFLPSSVNDILREKKKVVFFMASRFSDRWKGTDRFIAAFREVLKEFSGQVFLIASGWGADYPIYQRMIGQDAQLSASVHLMDGALSKGWLRKMINSVDVVVDQFSLGWYGTAFIEAASIGKLVLIHLNRQEWDKHMEGLEFPPVLPCGNTNEIKLAMKQLIRSRTDIQESGKHLRDWAIRNHGMKTWVPRIEERMGQVRA